jgi:hypothetical protein
MFSVCARVRACAFYCVCVQVEALRRADHLRPRSPTDCLRSRENRSETESFMELGQGPNWGCSAKNKKLQFVALTTVSMIPAFWVVTSCKFP